jgi:hypothetical protein
MCDQEFEKKMDLDLDIDTLLCDPINIHPLYKIPLKPDWNLSGKSMSIPYNSNYHELIDQCLASFESVNYYYDNNTFTWTIEYGTKPIEVDASWTARKSINIGRVAALIAANKAIETNDWILEDADLDIQTRPQLERKWSKSKLCLYIDDKNNCLLLQFIRIDGDRSSSGDIWKRIKLLFK